MKSCLYFVFCLNTNDESIVFSHNKKNTNSFIQLKNENNPFKWSNPLRILIVSEIAMTIYLTAIKIFSIIISVLALKACETMIDVLHAIDPSALYSIKNKDYSQAALQINNNLGQIIDQKARDEQYRSTYSTDPIYQPDVSTGFVDVNLTNNTNPNMLPNEGPENLSTENAGTSYASPNTNIAEFRTQLARERDTAIKQIAGFCG